MRNKARLLIVERLRAARHLLVLDNLELVTGAHLAVGTALPEAERARLKRFLHRWAGGKTLVLLGSRGGEEWAAQPEPGQPAPLRDEAVYEWAGWTPRPPRAWPSVSCAAPGPKNTAPRPSSSA